jgi:hypothetical protein
VPFAVQASRGCSTPCDLALALAAEFVPVRRARADRDDLLFNRVAPDGAGHPLLLAIACAEAARRAGLPVGIVAGADGAFVAHRELAEPLLVDPARGALRDPVTLRRPVSWQCCHQVAAPHPQPHRQARRARRPRVLGAAGGRAAPRAAVRRADARAPGG